MPASNQPFTKRVGTFNYLFTPDGQGGWTITLVGDRKPKARVKNGKIERKRPIRSGYRSVSTTRASRDDDLLDLWVWLIIWDEIFTDEAYGAAYADEVAAADYTAADIATEVEAAQADFTSGDDGSAAADEGYGYRPTMEPEPAPEPVEDTRPSGGGNHGGGGSDDGGYSGGSDDGGGGGGDD